jgi:ParB-like chromosome segregation protein Spo0J
MEGKIQLEWIPIIKINPAEYNPRVINQSELDGLTFSIKKFGFVDPLIVNQKTGNLVGGHQRLKAAQVLGLKKVPVVFINKSLEEEKALNITLNSHTTQGKFDLEMLSTLLEEIKIELPEMFNDLRMDVLEHDLKIGFNPTEFDFDEEKEIDEKIKTEKECPSCGYKY